MTIEERVEKLEKSARRWRAAALGMGVVLAAAVCVGAGTAGQRGDFDHISARSIFVSDGTGQGGMTISYAPGRGPSILMKSPSGKAVVQAFARDGEAGDPGAWIYASTTTGPGAGENKVSIGADERSGQARVTKAQGRDSLTVFEVPTAKP